MTTRFCLAKHMDGLPDSDVQYKAQAAQVFEKGAKVTWLNNNKNPEQGTVVRVFYDGGEPKTAMVDTGSQRKKVQYTALKEKSAKRPQWSVELTLHLEKGMMVFWQCEGELVGGLILEMDSGDFGTPSLRLLTSCLAHLLLKVLVLELFQTLDKAIRVTGFD